MTKNRGRLGERMKATGAMGGGGTANLHEQATESMLVNFEGTRFNDLISLSDAPMSCRKDTYVKF